MSSLPALRHASSMPALHNSLLSAPVSTLKRHRLCRKPCQPRMRSAMSMREEGPPQEDFDGLNQDEDWTVPGGAFDSLSSNTQLGKAVQEACDELETLGGLERKTLNEAQNMLEKLGYKGNILQADIPREDCATAARIQAMIEAAEQDDTAQE